MALGELYIPKGLALETARAVLEVECPMAVNVAMGCPNGCPYCYGGLAFKKKDWTVLRRPKVDSTDLVIKQLKEGKVNPEGVFISFSTDPLATENMTDTIKLARHLTLYHDFPVAILSKSGFLNLPNVRHGATIVSKDLGFKNKWEPHALKIDKRIEGLQKQHKKGYYTWVSMEPYPTPALWEQDILKLLEELKFVDFIIFGKWNYEKLAKGKEAVEFYKNAVAELIYFCNANQIRYHVKSETLKFIGRKV